MKLHELPIFLADEQLYTGRSFEKIGFIDSDPDSIIGRTVQEEYFYALVAGGGIAEEQMAVVDLRPFGLSDKLTRETRYLSGGEKQRLQTAGALAGGRKQLVVADLSASNLDGDFVTWFVARMKVFCCNGGALILSGLRCEQIANLTGVAVRKLVLSNQQSPIYSAESVPDSTVFPCLANEQAELGKAFKERVLGDSVVKFSGMRRRSITATGTFELKAGEVVRLTGRNGIGKTTLGNILMGRVPKRELIGELYMADKLRPVMSRQFPDRSLIGGTIKAELPSSDLRKICEINDDLGRNPRDLPFGVRKLISIATTLSLSGGLAILDEPTCGMDCGQKARFVALLNEFPEQAVLLITHDDSLVTIGREVRMGEA